MCGIQHKLVVTQEIIIRSVERRRQQMLAWNQSAMQEKLGLAGKVAAVHGLQSRPQWALRGSRKPAYLMPWLTAALAGRPAMAWAAPCQKPWKISS